MSQLLTVKEASVFLKIHPNTVYRLVKEGSIPHVRKRGVGIRIRKEDLEAWLDHGSVKNSHLFKSLSKIDIALDNYDRLFLKGGPMSQKGKVWKYPFGSVYLRQTKSGKGRWYIYYKVDKGRVRHVVENAQSRTDALKVLQTEVADTFRGKHGFKKELKNVKFSEYADLYLESYARINKRSWKTDGYMLRRLREFFKERDLREINSLLIEQFRSSLLKDGATKSTANRYLALLKLMFNLAIDWEYLKENPAKKVKLFSEKDNLKERILSWKEEQRLLEACVPYLKSIILVGLHTGMRKGEILNLKWSQVDFERMTIRVENTKSGKPRSIPINENLLEELTKLKMMNGGSSYIFVNPDTHKPLQDIKKSFRGALKRSGIDGLRFHDLRHTFASRLVEEGVDLITVKDLLGHHSVRVTERYTHSSSEQKRGAVAKLAFKEKPNFIPKLSTQERPRVLNDLFSIN